MRHLKILAIVLFLCLPAQAVADTTNIPDSATWYFHADFDAMRKGDAGRGLYDWLDAEVFEEIRGEVGIDFAEEANYLTAFSGAGEGPVILLDGTISQDTKDKVIALVTVAADGDLQTFKSSGKKYFLFSDDDDSEHEDNDRGDLDIQIESLEDEAYISLALKNKIVVTNTQEQMKELLANNGKIDAGKKQKNALFVLRAERSLIQAGARAEEMDGDDAWDSNILKNTKQVAVLLADLGEMLGVEAQLITTKPEMANSLASIVRGLISLQVFNDDIEPELASVLQSTTVDVAGSTLKISLALEPDTVVSALED